MHLPVLPGAAPSSDENEDSEPRVPSSLQDLCLCSAHVVLRPHLPEGLAELCPAEGGEVLSSTTDVGEGPPCKATCDISRLHG